MSSIDIVIAHYNEDIEWLRPYAENVIIYHKGDEQGPRFPVKKRAKLPNVGREGHTYLHHIIENYDKLTDSTIFLQGSISDHTEHGASYDSIDSYIFETEKYGFGVKYLGIMKKSNPQIIRIGKFKDMIENGYLERSDFSFAEYYKLIFNKQQPSIMPVFFGANFGVKRNLIHKNALSFYKYIYISLDKSGNPEEGHYLERLRFMVFNHKSRWKYNYVIKIIKSLFR